MIRLTLILTRTRLVIILVKWTTQVDEVDFLFWICLRAVGTSQITSQLDVCQFQGTIIENVWWGGESFTMLDGKGKRRMALLWTQEYIGKASMKMTCCYQKN